jgi:hypothetical protein
MIKIFSKCILKMGHNNAINISSSNDVVVDSQSASSAEFDFLSRKLKMPFLWKFSFSEEIRDPIKLFQEIWADVKSFGSATYVQKRTKKLFCFYFQKTSKKIENLSELYIVHFTTKSKKYMPHHHHKCDMRQSDMAWQVQRVCQNAFKWHQQPLYYVHFGLFLR